MYVQHDTNEDARRKWRRCVVTYEEGSIKHPFLIDDIEVVNGKNSNYYRLTGWVIENNTWVAKKLNTVKHKFNTEFPKLGFFMYRGVPVYLSRNSDRIYRKGYSENTVHKNNPLRDELMSISAAANIDVNNPSMVTAIFNPSYNTIQAAVRNIYGGTVYGDALSPNIAIVSSYISKYIVVLYKTNIVGYLPNNDNKIVISEEDMCLKEELTECGFNVEVRNEQTNKVV
ncbi:MAG: hypothetical protein KAS32_28540 [Candidatus Peribacteraceae bacterium]|nr:hypothetical protein [Candidatus Peribacteraceae bacterium]